MDSTRLEAYLGIPMPSIEAFEKPEENDKSRAVLYDALQDICSSSGKLEFHLGTGVVMPEIRLLERDELNAIGERRIFPKKHLKTCAILVVATAIPLSLFDRIHCPEVEASREDVDRFLARVEF